MGIWKIDPVHSDVTFKVKHLVISTVSGEFSRFEATVEADKADFADARISFEADIDSITTRNEQRDGHLKSPDFFDAVRYPKLTFRSDSIRKISESKYEVSGDLTIRGITKRVTLSAVYNGTVRGFGGGEVAGFELSGRLNRFDFGLRWNALTEAGGIVVGEEIRLEIAAELKKAA